MTPRRPTRQRVLFEEAKPLPAPELPQDIQMQLHQQMVQWMRAVAQTLGASQEVHDEQDQR